MDHAEYLIALRRDAPALLDAVRAADPDTTIAACPAWKPLDLAWHIGEVHRFWATVAGERRRVPPEPWPPERPASDEAVLAYADDSVRIMLEVLSEADPATRVWTWSDEHQDVAFILRRMAQETAVHRVDAERAAGRSEHEVEASLAADGIDEYLFRFLPWTARAAEPLGGSVHVHCTDTEGEWTVTPRNDGPDDVTTGHAKGDAALRGRAHHLLMALWRRDGTEHLDVFGDTSLAQRFLARTNNE